MEQLKVGDVVKLPSGGPAMTVTSVKGDRIGLAWMTKDGEPCSSEVPAAALQKVKAPG